MHRNDAKLWSAFTEQVVLSTGFPVDSCEMVARRLVAIVRRQELPDRRTWTTGDPLPDPPPKAVFDLDGDMWEHQDAGHGCYRMSEADQAHYADNHEVRGVRPWPFLLASEGPLTETGETGGAPG